MFPPFSLRAWVLLGLLLAGTVGVSQAQGPQGERPPEVSGLVLSDEAYGAVPLVAARMRGSVQTPRRKSLRAFTPFPGNQSSTSTCVGWATAYGARTILTAVEQGWTDRYEITRHAFSPSYVYNQIRPDSTCGQGTHIERALGLIRNEGVAPLQQAPFECALSITPELRETARPYALHGFHRLTEPDSTSAARRLYAERMRQALAADHPVVIGMHMPASLRNAYGNEVWRAGAVEAGQRYAHAMVVVGYDDDKFGGAFEVMNSWGPTWGQEGYIWVPYQDLIRFVFEAYEAFGAPPETRTLAGALTLSRSGGTRMPVTLLGAGEDGLLRYRLQQAYPAGTQFQVLLANREPAYVYSFSSDATRKTTRLLPPTDSIAAYLPYTNAAVSLPGDDYNFTLDPNALPGTDYFTILYSKRPIALDSLRARLELGEGTFEQRLARELGRRLLPPRPDPAATAETIRFTAEGTRGDVVALVIEVPRAALPGDDRRAPHLTLLAPVLDEAARELVVRPEQTSLRLRGTALDDHGPVTLIVNGRAVQVDASGLFGVTVPLARLDSLRLQATDAAGHVYRRTLAVARRAPDLEGPLVQVLSPRVEPGAPRGDASVVPQRTVQVTLRVSDASGVRAVYVNDMAATRRTATDFHIMVPLEAGEQVLRVRALDHQLNARNVHYTLVP